MKDTEFRGIVLNAFYEARTRGGGPLGFDDLQLGISKDDFVRISDQLDEHGLIEWHPIPGNQGQTIDGLGTISACGVDVIESEGEDSPLRIEMPVTQNIHISNSQGIQVGNHNTQNIISSIETLITQLDASDAAPEEKQEAKKRLRDFLKHPITAASLGSGLTKLLELL